MRKTVNPEIKKERRDAVVNWLKSLIVPVIICLIIGVGIYFIINYQNVKEIQPSVVPEGYDGGEDPIVLENSDYKLTLDPISTQISLEVKSSGKVWYSNPATADADSIALTSEKGNLKSPLIMQYATEQGQVESYSSYQYSIEKGLYSIEQPDSNSIKVNYSIGNIDRKYKIPPLCSVEDFEYWLGQIEAVEKKKAQLTKDYYQLLDLEKLIKDKEKAVAKGKEVKEDKDPDLIKEKYPVIEEMGKIYILRDGTKKNVKQTLEDYFEEAGYTDADYEKHEELFEGDNTTEASVFNISIVYRLNEDGFQVELPYSEMQFQEATPLYTVTPLPYFGCGSSSDEGYMMVPAGGGGIIRFNNGKLQQSAYYANCYGWDYCQTHDQLVHMPQSYFNVFGISQGNDSFLCILEDGASYGAIQADISGRNNTFNYANSIYSVCLREQFDVGSIANSDVFKYKTDLPDETIIQKYVFLDSGNYVDMAKKYQDYLQAKFGSYLTLNTETEAPVTVEVVGAVDKREQVMGIPMQRPLVLTTFEEASNLIEDLSNNGFKNLSVKLTGWCNGGVNQKILEKTKVLSKLGGKKGLKNLSDKVSGLGANLYLNGITQYAYDSNIFDGFFSYTDAAKLISKERCTLQVFSSVTYSARDGVDAYYMLHTDLAMKMVDNLLDACDKYNANVAFEDIGVDLSSDFYEKKPYSRDSVMKLQAEKLKSIDDSGKKIMINMGNDYAIPYADIVTEMDLQGSDYTILDEKIPFFQLALHGYIDYTGNSLNICGNIDKEVLIAAEYGAGLYFTVMDESAFTLQNTLYTQYYGCNYDAWKETIVDTYTRYNKELGHIFNQEMVNHANLNENVSCTEYQDGTKVYVNYGYVDFTAPDGTVIPSKDYKVVRK